MFFEKHFLSLIDGWREKGYSHYPDYFYAIWCGCSKVGEDNSQIDKLNNPYADVKKN